MATDSVGPQRAWKNRGIPVRVLLTSGTDPIIVGVMDSSDEVGIALSNAKKGADGKGGEIGDTFIPYTVISRIDKTGEGPDRPKELIEQLRKQAEQGR